MVINLGAAPAGWLQMAPELSGGTILGVDIRAICSIDGVITIRGDIIAEDILDRIKQRTSGEDVVLCDAAPNPPGD